MEQVTSKEVVHEVVNEEIFVKENTVNDSSLEQTVKPHHQAKQQVHFQPQLLLIEDKMVPPEFIHKIQPCQVIEESEARFECTFKGEPKPFISWFRDDKMIIPSNLYSITTDENSSILLVKRASPVGSVIFTVKAENVAGLAKSSANLVVEPKLLWNSQNARRVGQSVSPRQMDSYTDESSYIHSSPTSASGHGIVKSVQTCRLSAEDAALSIRASPEGSVAPTFLHSSHDTRVKPGDFLVGARPMDVKWTKDGEKMKADKEHKLLMEGDLYTLLILDCSPGPDDQGGSERPSSSRLSEECCEARLTVTNQDQASNEAIIRSLSEDASTSALIKNVSDTIERDSLNASGWEKIREMENPRPVNQIVETGYPQLPRFLTHIVDYVEKNEGDSVHFECCLSPVDDPDLKTEWFFNGRPLVTGSRFHTIDDFGFIVLDIDWLFPRDTGEYVCRASNKYGSDITRTVLRVKPDKNIDLDSQLDNPMIIDKLRQLEFPDVVQESIVEKPDRPAHFVQQLRSHANKRQFIEGDYVHFEARVGPPTDGNLVIEWFHNGKPLISGHRFRPSFDFGHIQLDILYVYPEDSGRYKCVARNKNGTDTSEFDIHVIARPSLIYQTQLPEEMIDGVRKITEMEAMWNRPPDPEEEEPPAERVAPQFVLKPKACTAFEGSCARFCCRIISHPRARLTWTINGQEIVSGSRYKLTYDGMYHLTIPKCQLSDAGKVEVHARNPLGGCYCATELKVKHKVDDYRGVLKNSPNPWYDRQSLSSYQRHRSLDTDDDEDFVLFQMQRLEQAGEPLDGPLARQFINYMEPGTPDVNLLARTFSPFVEPGDLHPSVVEQQVIMAPAPSTIKRAMIIKDDIQTPKKSFQIDTKNRQHQQLTSAKDHDLSHLADNSQTDQHQQQRQTFGPQSRDDSSQSSSKDSNAIKSNRATHHELYQQYQKQQRDQKLEHQNQLRLQQRNQKHQAQQQTFEVRLPPPSPESVVHGKEVLSHTNRQTQIERRANKEIVREIIDREIFEHEHKGVTKENAVRGSSLERSITPEPLAKRQVHFQPHLVLIEDHMTPPEFIQKIQPCQALDGDEARFECVFRGEPRPTISWYVENKMIKPSNLYNITTDETTSSLTIKRVSLASNAVYTVKAENVAGSAKSSANLVVEPHPFPETHKAGIARQVSPASFTSQPDIYTGESSIHIRQSSPADPHKVVKSVRTRRLNADEMATLIRASPEGQVAPTFLHTIHDTRVRPGELARLDARLVGSHPMEIKWLKDGQRVRVDTGHKLLLEGDLYTLLILESSPEDQGIYECIATNLVGEARCEARLVVSDESRASSVSRHTPDISNLSSNVHYTSQSGGLFEELQQPERTHFGISQRQFSSFNTGFTVPHSQSGQVPKLIKRLESQQVKEGKSVTLRCQISSFPMPEVQWYKDNSVIKPSKYFRIFKDNDETYCLRILEVFPEDQGEYKCVARAAKGQSFVETMAMITVIPNTPK